MVKSESLDSMRICPYKLETFKKINLLIKINIALNYSFANLTFAGYNNE